MLELSTVGFGYAGDVHPIGASWLACEENRVERRARALVEWYVNDERGIEHGWTIPAAPQGPAEGLLRIELSVAGLVAQVAADGRSAVFEDDDGEVRVRYDSLVAWDATGRELPVRLLETRAGLAVELSRKGASHPITIDPILGGPTWTAESDQVRAYFGNSVSEAGDVNGDGFDDLIVGAQSFDNGQMDEGRAFLYLGSVSGPPLCPDTTLGSNQTGARFGISVSGAGDVSGQGLDGVIVGAYTFDNGQTDEGRVFLYVGLAQEDCNGNGVADACDVANGTSLDCNTDVVPDECDITSGASTDTNGNGIPDECEEIGTKYCHAPTNETGSPAAIVAYGSASASAGNLRLISFPVPNQPAIFFHGRDQVDLPWGCTFLCTNNELVRGTVVLASGNTASYRYDNSDGRHSLMSFIGTTRNFQHWYRSSLYCSWLTSNAVSVSILP